jgi:hypothetical protein
MAYGPQVTISLSLKVLEFVVLTGRTGQVPIKRSYQEALKTQARLIHAKGTCREFKYPTTRDQRKAPMEQEHN